MRKLTIIVVALVVANCSRTPDAEKAREELTTKNALTREQAAQLDDLLQKSKDINERTDALLKKSHEDVLRIHEEVEDALFKADPWAYRARKAQQEKARLDAVIAASAEGMEQLDAEIAARRAAQR